MCVFVCLFCSVVVVLFVVGRQQHCRYIVIDAMVYPKNWIWKTSFSTGKTSGVFGLNLVFLHLVSRQRRFWIQKLRHCAWIDRDEFWMMLHHLLCVLEDVFFFDYLLIMNVIWNHEHFSTDMIRWSVHGSDVIRWGCHVERGYGNLTPYGRHPLGKGEATCHSSSWHSFMHGRLVENILLVARETCALWSIWITIFY